MEYYCFMRPSSNLLMSSIPPDILVCNPGYGNALNFNACMMNHWQKRARNRVLEKLWQRQGLEASDPRTPLLAPILRIGDPPQPADHQDTACENTFGAPNIASCLQALQELESFRDNLDLDPAKSGPQITRIGNCAIAIGFERVVTVGWNMVRRVVGVAI